MFGFFLFVKMNLTLQLQSWENMVILQLQLWENMLTYFAKLSLTLCFKSHFLRNTGKAREWCLQILFVFSYFILNDDIWHLLNFSQNPNSFPRYWGPNFRPFRAKSDSLNEIATLKANICVENIVEVCLFSFSENMGWIIEEK